MDNLSTVIAPACPQCREPLPEGGDPDICPGCLVRGLMTEDETDPGQDPETEGLTTLGGHAIIEEIGTGGMGIIFKAREPVTGRIVAMKMLRTRMGGELEDMRERFRTEATALSLLDHPAILPLYRFGEDRGRQYFTMKYAGGGSLSTRLKAKCGPGGPREIAKLMVTLANAVACAHTHGVLHRDIKPGNVLFDENGAALVADFGLARLSDREASITQSGGLFGTPNYMAPEVAMRGARHARTTSDVYGLGAVFYELLTGRPPFEAESVPALLRQIAERDAAPPRTVPGGLRDRIPPDVETICQKCLEKEPSRRYAGAAELEVDLRRWLNGYPISARPVSPAGRLWRWTRRNPLTAGLASLLSLSLIAGGVGQALALRATSVREAEARTARKSADEQVKTITNTLAAEMVPLGRLDVLNTAFRKVAEYYDNLPPGQRDAASRANESLFLLLWADALSQQEHLTDAAANASRAESIALDLSGHDGLRIKAHAARLRGVVAFHQGAEDEAIQHYNRSLQAASEGAATDYLLAAEVAFTAAELGRLHSIYPYHSDAEWRRSFTAAELGRLHSSHDRSKEALAAFKRGREAVEPWLHTRGSGPLLPVVVLSYSTCVEYEGECHEIRSYAAEGTQEAATALEQALICYRESHIRRKELCLSAPQNLVWARDANLPRVQIASILRRMGPEHDAEALEELIECEKQAGKLASHNLTNLRWQRDHATTLSALGHLHLAARRPTDAARCAREGIAIMRDVVEKDGRREWLMELAELCEIAWRSTPELNAAEVLKTSPALMHGILTASMQLPRIPASFKNGRDWGRALIRRLEKLGAWEDGRSVWNAWTSELRRRATAEPDDGVWPWVEAGIHRAYADLCNSAGDWQSAAMPAQRAALLRRRLLLSGFHIDELAGETENALTNYHDVLKKTGNYPALLESLTSSLPCLDVTKRSATPPPGWRKKWAKMFLDGVEILASPESGRRAEAASIAAAAVRDLNASTLTPDEQIAIGALMKLVPAEAAGVQPP